MSHQHPSGSIELEDRTWMYLCRGIVPDGDPGGPVEALQVWFSVPGRSGEWIASPELPPDEFELTEDALRGLLRETLAARGGDAQAPESAGASI